MPKVGASVVWFCGWTTLPSKPRAASSVLLMADDVDERQRGRPHLLQDGLGPQHVRGGDLDGGVLLHRPRDRLIERQRFHDRLVRRRRQRVGVCPGAGIAGGGCGVVA